MKLTFIRLLCACLCLTATSIDPTTAATIVTFDNLPESGFGGPTPSSYEGLTWSNFYCLNGILNPNTYPLLTDGYYYGVVSASNVAVNGFGQPAEIDSTTNFDFLSAYFTGAWHSNLNIEVEGFNGSQEIYDTIVVACATNPTLSTFNYLDIDRLYFNSYGGDVAFGHDGGNQFAMDNLTFEFIPEPSTILLASLGTLTLYPFLKRRRT